MGLNDDMIRLPIIVDVETCPHPCAPDFIERTDPASIRAPKNYTKPDSIAAFIEQRKGELETEYAEKLDRAALDWNLARIVALAWSTDGGDTVVVRPCADEVEEALALTEFWRAAQGRRLLGFAARSFDAPTLIQRSRLLQVNYQDVNLARFGKGSVIDLREVLTFDDARYEALMTRSLKVFCRRFGIPVDDPIDGVDIPSLIATGHWADVVAHVTSDLRLTAALAKRLQILPVAAEVL
jgi:hypothetical protein